jgi:ABC-type ATPase involved in cell division
VTESAAAATEKSGKAIIKLRGVRKVYHRDTQEIPVLEGIDLDIGDGAFEALMGPSGSGKTTLLNLIAGIDNATSGTVEVAGTDLTRLSEGDLATWRARNIGFIFQFYNLLPVFTAFQNVESARSAWRRRCAWWGSKTAWIIIRASSRADRSSAWPSPAPSSPIRRSSSLMSRPATSIARARRRS